MGEYATRISDGERVKIGTCEDMLYLRFEDARKVKVEHGNVDPVIEAHELRFRLPFPDEDGVGIGSYKDPFRGLMLWRDQFNSREFFSDPSKIEDPGTMQIYHKESGLLINVPCFHGEKLPDVGECKAFWNGKGHPFELFQVRPAKPNGTDLHIYPVLRCAWCRNIWRYTWDEVLPYVNDPVLLARLKVYAEV